MVEEAVLLGPPMVVRGDGVVDPLGGGSDGVGLEVGFVETAKFEDLGGSVSLAEASERRAVELIGRVAPSPHHHLHTPHNAQKCHLRGGPCPPLEQPRKKPQILHLHQNEHKWHDHHHRPHQRG